MSGGAIFYFFIKNLESYFLCMSTQLSRYHKNILTGTKI